MPASGSYTQHAQWCEIVEGGGREEKAGGRERWMEGEAEEVEAECEGGRGLCLHRELSKDKPEHICEEEMCRSVMMWVNR